MKKRTYSELSLIDVTQRKPQSKRRRIIPDDSIEEQKNETHASGNQINTGFDHVPDWAAAFGNEEDDKRVNQQLIDDCFILEESKVEGTQMEVDVEEDTMMKDELKVETEAEIKIKNEHEQEKFQKNLVAKFLDQIDLTSGNAITTTGQN